MKFKNFLAPKRETFQNPLPASGVREKMVDFFNFITVFTYVMPSYVLKISHNNNNVHNICDQFLACPSKEKFCGRPRIIL